MNMRLLSDLRFIAREIYFTLLYFSPEMDKESIALEIEGIIDNCMLIIDALEVKL